MQAQVHEGLGNRINALVSAITLSKKTKQPAKIHWLVNDHCPVEWQKIFRPIEGIVLENRYGDAKWEYSKDSSNYCHYYFHLIDQHPNDKIIKQIWDSYRTVINSIIPEPIEVPRKLAGVQFRGHLEHHEELDKFLENIDNFLSRHEPINLLIVSDDKEAELAITKDVSINIISYKNGYMDSDLDRSENNVIQMAKKIKSLTKCRLGILTNSHRSTITDSARAFGCRVEYAVDYYDRDYELEEFINPKRIYA